MIPRALQVAGNIVAKNKSFINLPGSANLVFYDNACFVDLGKAFLAIYCIESITQELSQNFCRTGMIEPGSISPVTSQLLVLQEMISDLTCGH